ncbi:MAG: glycosyltransferase family 2 protein [Gemmatimonadota bacterium]
MRELPFLSVIVPAYQGGKVLPLSLGALARSDLPRSCWELIVVDDASTDDTAAIAARYADGVVRLPGKPHGPAYARNRGFEAARGAVAVFIDADVCVRPDTLRRFAWLFAEDSALGAVFGSYCDAPPAPGFISQYRNLMHHYVHHQNPGPAETFWAGCGAIRSSVFVECGMYDEWHYVRPQIEDIELGQRIRAHGHSILLRPEIQGTHLKQWTIKNVIVTDLHDRGVPWMRLIVEQGDKGNTSVLNVKAIEKINTALIWLSVLGLLVSVVTFDLRWAAASLLLILPVIYTNRRMYAFFARVRGAWFSLRVVPVHLLYYFLNGISALWGVFLHHAVGEPKPPAYVQAFAEVGVETWPPIPSKTPRGPWQQPVTPSRVRGEGRET